MHVATAAARCRSLCHEGGVVVRRFIHASPLAGVPAGAIAIPGNADRTGCGAAAATRPARRHGAALIVAALGCLCSTAAVAQWNPHFTASMGRGYGNIALSQSILSGTRRLGTGATVRSNVPRAASLTPAQIDAALTYTADPTQSDRIRVAMIDTMGGQNPATREQMTKAFADDAVLKEFDRVMSANGHSSRNVADDMAALLVLCWEIYTGGTANKLQIAGAHRQSRGIFLGTPALRTMTNAEREEMAERIAYQFVISDMVNQVALRSGDQAQQAQIRQSAAAVMRQRVDIDITRLRLTERGFSKKS
jgi:hypothetical protein